jgi:peptidoglycan-N-acetylglucosamine deacetylase
MADYQNLYPLGMRSRALRLTRAALRPLRRASRAALTHAAGVRRGLAPGTRAVALTFDDGPDPDYTGPVLDLLDELGVRATFFVVGEKARAHPQFLRRMAAAGHHIGSHSCSHPLPWTLGWRTLLHDYREGRRAAEAVTGQPVRLFRPPKGYIDLRGAAVMRLAGLRPWLWTIDPEDWRPGVQAGGIVRALDAMRPGDVLLLHDGLEGSLSPAALDRSATIVALPAIVALAREKGLDLVPLPIR